MLMNFYCPTILPAMLIKVKFFASLRDDFGKEAVCEVDQNSRVEDLFHKMRSEEHTSELQSH